jgi:hypothetical protein
MRIEVFSVRIVAFVYLPAAASNEPTTALCASRKNLPTLQVR